MINHQQSIKKNQLEPVRVWDPLVRIFHWALVVFVGIAWLSADEIDNIHIWAGYTVASLVGFRLIWGVIGSRYSRFSDFTYSWSNIKQYLKSLLKKNPKHYLGHNPAGGAMVIALLICMAMLTFFGMALIATDGEGPLAATFIAGWSEDWIEDIHEFFANILFVLISAHILGVLVSSVLHSENLISAMVTGKKWISKPEVINDNQ
jgi:cytochrome b